MGNEEIKKKTKEKDLGVTILDDMSPEEHISRSMRNDLLRNVKAAFTYIDNDMTKN